MKKIFTIFLVMLLVLAPVMTFAEPTNYASDLTWTASSSLQLEVNDGVTTCTGIKYAWDSPSISILPTLIDMLGDDDELIVILSMEVRAEFTEGNEGKSVTAKPLIRGNNTMTGIKDHDAWMEAYEEALDGDETFFGRTKEGHVVHRVGGGNVQITDSDWVPYEAEFVVTRNQLINDFSSTWNFCVDSISSPAIFKSLSIRNFAIYKADDIEVEATPTPTPTPTPTKAPTATKAPAASQTATDAPADDVQPEETPIIITQEEGANKTTVIIVCSICSVVIVGCFVTVILIKEKKKD